MSGRAEAAGDMVIIRGKVSCLNWHSFTSHLFTPSLTHSLTHSLISPLQLILNGEYTPYNFMFSVYFAFWRNKVLISSKISVYCEKRWQSRFLNLSEFISHQHLTLSRRKAFLVYSLVIKPLIIQSIK